MSELNENQNISDKALQEEIDIQKSLSPEENAKRVLDLKKENEELKKVSSTDPLTGLPTKKALLEDMKETENILIRKGGESIVLFVDIDDLDKINASKGHSGGDEAIKNVAHVLKNSLRKTDKVARGGDKADEFIVVLNFTDEQGALNYYEKLSKQVSENETLRDVSISVGASKYDFDENRPKKDLLTTIVEADDAMYVAKQRKGLRQENVGLIFYNEINKNEQK